MGKGEGSKKLISGNEFLEVKNRVTVIQITKPSNYTMKGKGPYGIAAKRKLFYDKTFFVVSKIHPVGSVHQWNKEFPDMRVSIGDVVREVNGLQGSSSEVQMMMASNPGEEKELLIFHYPDMA